MGQRCGYGAHIICESLLNIAPVHIYRKSASGIFKPRGRSGMRWREVFCGRSLPDSPADSTSFLEIFSPVAPASDADFAALVIHQTARAKGRAQRQKRIPAMVAVQNHQCVFVRDYRILNASVFFDFRAQILQMQRANFFVGL